MKLHVPNSLMAKLPMFFAFVLAATPGPCCSVFVSDTQLVVSSNKAHTIGPEIQPLSCWGRSEVTKPELVGGFNQPLWKIMEFVSWGYEIPNCFWKVIIHSCSSHHQAVKKTHTKTPVGPGELCGDCLRKSGGSCFFSAGSSGLFRWFFCETQMNGQDFKQNQSLVGGWPTPLKKWWSSPVGMMKFPTVSEKKSHKNQVPKHIFQIEIINTGARPRVPIHQATFQSPPMPWLMASGALTLQTHVGKWWFH